MKKSFSGFAFLFLVFSFLFLSLNTFSQCAMCRRTVETSQTNDNRAGRGLNTGILYLLAIPYVLGGVGAIVWYKNRKKD